MVHLWRERVYGKGSEWGSANRRCLFSNRAPPLRVGEGCPSCRDKATKRSDAKGHKNLIDLNSCARHVTPSAAALHARNSTRMEANTGGTCDTHAYCIALLLAVVS